MTATGIGPTLYGSLPWLGADKACGAGSAGDGGGAQASRADEGHDEAVERPIDSGKEQLMAMTDQEMRCA